MQHCTAQSKQLIGPRGITQLLGVCVCVCVCVRACVCVFKTTGNYPKAMHLNIV